MLVSAQLLSQQDLNSFYEAHFNELNQLKGFVDVFPPQEMFRKVFDLHSRYISDIESAIERINILYSSEFKFRRERSFYDLLLNLDTYKEEAVSYSIDTQAVCKVQ